MAGFQSPSNGGAMQDGRGQEASPRVAAIAMLKRAASTREAASPSSTSSSRTPSPALSRSASSAASAAAVSRSRNRSRTISSANPAHTDEDTSLFFSPSDDAGASSLERTASLLARQLALSKLTGTAPPTPPTTFFTPDEPMPSLAELQERARAKLARERGGGTLHRNNTVASPAGVAATAMGVLSGLKRNNTVTGIGGVGGLSSEGQVAEQEEEQQSVAREDHSLGREQVRANLMRKLSARRLEGPSSSAGARDRLGVVGRIGKARPRSGSISALDWRDGADPASQTPPPVSTVPSLPPASSYAALAPPLVYESSSSSTAAGRPHLGRSLPPLVTSSHENGRVGIGISMPPSAATDRSETPLSERSSLSGISSGGPDGSRGGDWAAERDRQSVLARARGEGAWEFEEALHSERVERDGEKQGQEEREVIRDSHLETTPRPNSYVADYFATPKEEWDGSPHTLHSATLAPERGATPLTISSSDTVAPFSSTSTLAPPVPSTSQHATYRTAGNSGSSSSASSAHPSPDVPPSISSSSRRAPFLPSFGIAAVEEPVRKRGSSASSSIAGQLLDTRRFRGSDAMLLSVSSSGSMGQPITGRGSVVSTASTSAEEDEIEEEEEELRDGFDEDEERRGGRLGPREQRLVDKVEKKREAAQARAMSPDADKEAFPPPSDGYQFPSPRESQDMRNRQADEDDPQQLFQHLASASSASSPPPVPVVASPRGRKGRDFPFNLPFQSFPSGVELPASPRLPDPISPTSVIDDPLLFLSFPPHASPPPRVGVSPATSARARFSPTMARHGGADAGAVMERSFSQQSKAASSAAMVKSPSTESAMSYRSADASSYHSPIAMRRDLSSSSRSSDFSLSPRVPQLTAEQLPSNRILAKLDSILGPEVIDSDKPSPLDSPPRKLLLHGSVLQVVNANTVKDRHLFLFNDLLVIAKPLVEDHPLTGEPIQPTLDTRFLVKSVVEFKHLKLAAAEDPADDPGGGSSSPSGKKRHPLLVAFVDRFANDPARAIASLVQKGGLANDGPTIANLLFRNTDLNRNQLGAYLANPQHRHVLRAYIERFRFQGVRVDDALRLFCMSVRLPHDITQAEYVLGVLAGTWTESNTASGFDPSLTFNLVMATLKLSDALHGAHDPTGGSTFFAQSTPPSVPPSVDDFIGNFRAQDTRLVVPEDLLARIYTSVRRERVEQASDNSIFSMTPDIEATIEPAKLPTRLTYRSPSDVFTITIPEPDPKFTIKLHGNDLQFDPPVLSFARSKTQSFKVTGNALGVRVMVLIKRGANAPRYQGLPLNKAFSIERGFMQHTFQVSFTNHLDLKRKYMFSTTDGPSRTHWLRLLRERIIAALDAPSPGNRTLAAAQAVSIQVLRDVFLPPDEPLATVPAAAPSPRPNLAAPRFGQPVAPTVPPRTAGTRVGTPTRPGNQLVRSNSVSKLYGAHFRHEADLGGPGSLADRRNGALVAANLLTAGRGSIAPVPVLPKDDPVALQASAPYIKEGKELVVTTEQNSLLPMLLSFLNTGLEAAPHPISLQGSAFQLPPLPAAHGLPPPHPLNPFPHSSAAVPYTSL
ncbi:hypothetical protein JCM11251_007275 [Rhodosporidiobolus azoricus]